MKRFTVVFAITAVAFGVALAELSGFPLIAEVASFLRGPAVVMPRVVICPTEASAAIGALAA